MLWQLEITGLGDLLYNGSELNGIYQLPKGGLAPPCSWATITTKIMHPVAGGDVSGYFQIFFFEVSDVWVMVVGLDSEPYLASNNLSPLPDAFFHCSGHTDFALQNDFLPLFDLTNARFRITRTL